MKEGDSQKVFYKENPQRKKMSQLYQTSKKYINRYNLHIHISCIVNILKLQVTIFLICDKNLHKSADNTVQVDKGKPAICTVNLHRFQLWPIT